MAGCRCWGHCWSGFWSRLDDCTATDTQKVRPPHLYNNRPTRTSLCDISACFVDNAIKLLPPNSVDIVRYGTVIDAVVIGRVIESTIVTWFTETAVKQKLNIELA